MLSIINKPRQKLSMIEHDKEKVEILLDNVLDALDRLYDNTIKPIDLYAILYATSLAVVNSTQSFALDEAAENLRQIIQSKKSDTEQNTLALSATDKLRSRLTEE
jgi:hypothetical protein